MCTHDATRGCPMWVRYVLGKGLCAIWQYVLGLSASTRTGAALGWHYQHCQRLVLEASEVQDAPGHCQATQVCWDALQCGGRRGSSWRGVGVRWHPAHPNNPLAKAAVGCLPEKPSMTSFWGLLCKPVGLVVSHDMLGLLLAHAKGEYKKSCVLP